YFRESRERFLGGRLEEVQAARDEGLAAYRKSLEPLRSMLGYQPFIGGASPLFSDYILFGGFPWARGGTNYPVPADHRPVAAWFERCLDLHDGIARKVAAAAA